MNQFSRLLKYSESVLNALTHTFISKYDLQKIRKIKEHYKHVFTHDRSCVIIIIIFLKQTPKMMGKYNF